jgi:hypothetical protein
MDQYLGPLTVAPGGGHRNLGVKIEEICIVKSQKNGFSSEFLSYTIIQKIMKKRGKKDYVEKI